MLDSLRKFGSSIIGKIMMAFLLVGLAGFGISGVLTSIGSNTVARVGDQEISVRDFQRAYNNQLDATARQIGSVPTAEQALQMGIPGTVLNSLAANAALDNLSNRMGLGASDDRLGKMLRDDPSFAGTMGQFERSTFTRILQSAGYTETEYVNMLRKGAGRQQFVSAALAEIAVPQTMLDLVNRYSSDKRQISYYVLRSDNVAAPAAPTEAELATYLSDNQTQYRTQPTRTARFIVLDVATLAKSVEVTDDEIAAEYERTQSNYAVVETRAIRQVVLNDENKAIFEQGLEAGTSFDDLIAQTGLTPTDLGTLARDQVTDAALGDAAFALAEGGYIVIPGVIGNRAVEVSKINPAGVKPLEEVRDQIAQSLKEKDAKNQYADVLDQIEELRAAFRPIEEIAERFNLDLNEVTLTSSGAELSAIASIPTDSDARVASTVFSTEMGNLAPSIALASNLNVWFDLTNIEDARDQTLDEVRDEITATLLQQRTTALLSNAAAEDVAAVKGGMPIDLAATTRGTFVAPSEAFARSGLQASEIDGNVANAAFSGADGLVGSARNGNGNYVVFKVTAVTPPESPVPDAAKNYITETWRDGIYGALASALRNDAGLHIQQGTLSQLVGSPTGN